MQNARCLQFALVINETGFFFFYLTIWALSLDADPLDISAPSHIRGRQTENEDKNTVSAASCQRASPSLLAATVNVSFQPWYYHHAVYCFCRLEVCLTRQAVSCALLSFKIGSLQMQLGGIPQRPSVNWEVFIFLAARRPISSRVLVVSFEAIRRPLTGRNAHFWLTCLKKDRWRRRQGDR